MYLKIKDSSTQKFVHLSVQKKDFYLIFISFFIVNKDLSGDFLLLKGNKFSQRTNSDVIGAFIGVLRLSLKNGISLNYVSICSIWFGVKAWKRRYLVWMIKVGFQCRKHTWLSHQGVWQPPMCQEGLPQQSRITWVFSKFGLNLKPMLNSS